MRWLDPKRRPVDEREPRVKLGPPWGRQFEKHLGLGNRDGIRLLDS